MISCFLAYPNTPLQQSTLPLLTRKSSTPVGLMGLTYKTGKLMIKRISYDLGSKGVTCSAIDFESTAGRLVPSQPEPQRAGVLITSQSPRPEGSASLSSLAAQGNRTGNTAKRSCCILLEKPPPTTGPKTLLPWKGVQGWDRRPVSIASRHRSPNPWRVWGYTHLSRDLSSDSMSLRRREAALKACFLFLKLFVSFPPS